MKRSIMDRRDFLRIGTGRKTRRLELSGEQLLMKFLDATAAGAVPEFFARLEGDLRDVDELHLVGIKWLRRDDISADLARILNAFRTRGGRVVIE